MPVDFLSHEQVARYRRFRDEVTVGELEQFFRLDAKARAVVADKAANRRSRRAWVAACRAVSRRRAPLV
ncbi:MULTISPECIES: hypothetical protein [Thermomonosporaceae]|uniref:hypothetical protein n=1 Tax=Thermomonosporaceae TaxID=2012 RepID=UPI00255AD548|nr:MULTISPECIES: hypothetical protein [Thermomonosporaceae]MDL4776778.1 hypothetical protein [Actinomadura xylanilytica]